jgi:methionyl-tRNA formyltransferase
MKPEEIRIVYMGTPQFAVAPLELLIESGFQVAAVVTAPDRPAGRGKKVAHSAVKQFIALQHPEIPIYQPGNLKDPEWVQQLESLRPDLQVVVAFRMLPEAVWKIPRLGTLNLHASLLPQYRGAAPINHVIINGESETGVTTFLIDHQIDTGNILLQEKVSIGEKETAGELHDRLMQKGAALLLRTVEGLAEGSVRARSQKQLEPAEGVLKKAPKIHKEDCRIRWNREGRKVVNHIRGLSPYPGAFTMLSIKDSPPILCKIFGASFRQAEHHDQPGSIHTDGKKYLEAAVEDGYLLVESIQLEGKRRMGIGEFLAGYRFISGQSRFS